MGIFDKLFKKRSKKKQMTVGTVPTVEKKDFPEIKPVGSTGDLLNEWTKTLEMVEKHPLSQARVINTGVLTDLTHILNSMNEKLDALSKLDNLLDLLNSVKKQLSDANLSTHNVDALITNIKGLTVKDQDALNCFTDGVLLSTDDFAKQLKLSRSTASSRLNKLHSFGLLEKVADGKKIMYKKR